jgi:hypothetical protein
MGKAERVRRRQKIEDYIDASRKSPVAGAIYALVYGPLGCIYASPKSAFIALLAAVALGLIYWPLIGLVWLGCVVIAPYQVRAYNARVRRSARYHVI